jgi:hypothetical protein
MRGDNAPLRVLAVCDEPDEALAADPGVAGKANLILACGDLPFDYLGMLMNALDVPPVFVPGNHDPDLTAAPVLAGSGTPARNVTGWHLMRIRPGAGGRDAG